MLDELDLFDFTNLLHGNGMFDSEESFYGTPEGKRPESPTYPVQESEESINRYAQSFKGEFATPLTTGLALEESILSRQPKSFTDPIVEEKLKGSAEPKWSLEMAFEECDIFDCLELDNKLRKGQQTLSPSTLHPCKPQTDCSRTACPKPDPRDQTTIAKVIYTVYKKYLVTSCPINLKPYFRICPYSKNHRTLMDFEVPYLYAEHMDESIPGSLSAFQQFLKKIKPLIQEHAEEIYRDNQVRLSTFLAYLDRIYEAYNSGLDSSGRMRILYRTPSKLPGAMAKLQQIQARFP